MPTAYLWIEGTSLQFRATNPFVSQGTSYNHDIVAGFLLDFAGTCALMDGQSLREIGKMAKGTKPRRQERKHLPEQPAVANDTRALDQFDRRILAALLENSRATNVEIARGVGLSEAPCSRRIKRLETSGIIRGYTTIVEPEAVGIGFVAYVTLVLDYVTAATAEEFADKIRAIPEIISCYIVSGGYDAILHVAARDSRTYSDIVFDQLRRIPGVKDVRSSFIMRAIKEGRGLTLSTEAHAVRS